MPQKDRNTLGREAFFSWSPPGPCGSHVPAASPHAHAGAHPPCHLLILRKPDLEPATSCQAWNTNHGQDQVTLFSSVSSSFSCDCICKYILHCSLSAAHRVDDGGAGSSPPSPSCCCPPHHLAFQECGSCKTQGMPPLSYCSHSPRITFRKPLFFTCSRGAWQRDDILRAAQLGTGDLSWEQPSKGQMLLHPTLTCRLGVSSLFSLLSFSATLGFAQPGCSKGVDEQQERRVEGSSGPGDGHQC